MAKVLPCRPPDEDDGPVVLHPEVADGAGHVVAPGHFLQPLHVLPVLGLQVDGHHHRGLPRQGLGPQVVGEDCLGPPGVPGVGQEQGQQVAAVAVVQPGAVGPMLDLIVGEPGRGG